jgi:hypothetical protein
MKVREAGYHQGSFLGKKISYYKRYKHSRNFLDEKVKCQPWIIEKKPKSG